MTIKGSNNYIYILIISIFLLFIFLAQYTSISIHYSIFIFLTIILCLFCKDDDIISFGVSLIPLLTLFQSKYAILICIVFYLIRFSQNFRFTKSIILVLLMMVWELFHAYIYTFNLIEWIRSFAELIFCGFLLSLDLVKKTIDYKKIIRTLSFTTFFACTLLLLIQLRANSWNLKGIFEGYFRFGSGISNEDFSINYNPNTLGWLCLLSIMGSFVLVYRKESRIFDFISIVLLTCFGLFTMSRKFIIFELIFIILFVFFNKDVIKKFRYIIIIFIVGLISYFIINKYIPNLIELILDRFRVDDITNGRNYLFSFYTKHIFSNFYYFFIGIGLQNYDIRISQLYGANQLIPHNGIQELIVVWGIIGLLLFSAFIVEILKKTNVKENKINLFYYVPIVILILYTMGSQFISSSYLIMSLSAIYIFILVKNNDVTNNNHFYI